MANKLIARASILTNVGRRRQVNEDWCAAREPRDDEERARDGWLWIVADGVGAYGTGAEASQAAGEALLDSYRRSAASEPSRRLREAVEAANLAVWERRRAYVRQGQSRPVMTTLLAALVIGERAIIAHVGDCRAYLVKKGGKVMMTNKNDAVTYIDMPSPISIKMTLFPPVSEATGPGQTVR